MENTLQLVEHIAARARSECFTLDDGVDERRLGLEDRLDEVVDGVPGDEVGDVDRAGLADPVGAVFGLPVIGRHPVEIVEHHLRRRRQVHSRPASDDVRDEDAHVVFVLEPVDKVLSRVASGSFL